MDLVRTILCAFYDDGEIMVANFLLEGDMAFTDQQIAESVGLSQRQVRSVLEARLCKDFITEAENPTVGQVGGPSNNRGMQGTGFGGMTSAWYRVCPDILNATWYRLTQTEKAIIERLKATQENESYICYRCGNREFDSLRAVSLYSQTDGLFHCDICDDILHVRENRSLRENLEKVLNQFTVKFEPLKERLESFRRMYIPRHIVLKRTVYEKMLEEASAAVQNTSSSSTPGSVFTRDFSQFASALSNLTTGQAGGPTTTAAPEWIRGAQSVSGGDQPKHDHIIIQQELKKLKTEDNKLIFQPPKSADISTIIQTASIPKKEELKTDPSFDQYVLVNGISYPLGEARDNDELIEQMTDEEYTRFDQLIQKIGFK
jgi:transcription initiation factor IIE alpha subunit